MRVSARFYSEIVDLTPYFYDPDGNLVEFWSPDPSEP